jgi:hypothetical protein
MGGQLQAPATLSTRKEPPVPYIYILGLVDPLSILDALEKILDSIGENS